MGLQLSLREQQRLESVLSRKIKDETNTYAFTFSYKSTEAATKKYHDAIKNGLLD